MTFRGERRAGIRAALTREPRPRRTVIFPLFGSEEKGLWGSTYYREHPTVPLANIVEIWNSK